MSDVITTRPNYIIPNTATICPGEFDAPLKETMKTAPNKTKIGKNTSSDLEQLGNMLVMAVVPAEIG